MAIQKEGEIMSYKKRFILEVVVTVAILASVATYVFADGRITFATSESLNHETQDFLYQNGDVCTGLEYLPGAHDGNFGRWIITTVGNPLYTYIGGNHFNPVQECESK